MYERIVLDNGLQIVWERIPYVRSVSFGVWVKTGSRNEEHYNNGISHFIEHMLFKGTENRSAKDIADIIDSIGGQINAFTGKECTCFYTKTLDTDLEIAVELLSDMLRNSIFSKKDIETERKVISEEINMYEDYPEDMVHDLLSEIVWSENSLSLPILGTLQSLSGIDNNKFSEYMNCFYNPNNCVISVAGNFENEKLMFLIEKYFGGWENNQIYSQEITSPIFKKDILCKRKETEQVHVCIGFDGYKIGDHNIYSLLVLNNIVGGGMSSKLFQNIREEKGLVYSIYSYPTSYSDTGLFSIYAGVNPQNVKEVLLNIDEEIERIYNFMLSDNEIQMAKNQLKGSYILGLESTSSRMNSIGRSQLFLNCIKTQEEIIQLIDDVDNNSLNNVIKTILNNNKKGLAIISDLEKASIL